MSVEDRLGLGAGSDLLEQADTAWPGWCKRHPQLAVATDTTALRDWLRAAEPKRADEVLLALAELAALDGGNDIVAAAVLAWALMPGAGLVAHRLSDLSHDIDAIVAGQLWLEVRSFPWRRLIKVAANILMNLRAAVLRECGVDAQLRRADPTWYRTSLVAPELSFWECRSADRQAGGADAAAAELQELLRWACDRDVITTGDQALLLSLVEAADNLSLSRRRACGGLMAQDLNVQVAGELGISVRTLRRRTRQSIDALAEASKYRYSA